MIIRKRLVDLLVIVAATIGILAASSVIYDVSAHNHVVDSQYKDKYIIALETYDTTTNDTYQRIYYKVKRKDTSSARTMRDAAREMCESVYGGRLESDFSCRGVPNR